MSSTWYRTVRDRRDRPVGVIYKRGRIWKGQMYSPPGSRPFGPFETKFAATAAVIAKADSATTASHTDR